VSRSRAQARHSCGPFAGRVALQPFAACAAPTGEVECRCTRVRRPLTARGVTVSGKDSPIISRERCLLAWRQNAPWVLPPSRDSHITGQ
jgi:hypothetical protein